MKIEVVDAFLMLSKVEGIILAIESSHAVSYSMKLAAGLAKDQTIIINLSGRGDKDVAEIAHILQNKKIGFIIIRSKPGIKSPGLYYLCPFAAICGSHWFYGLIIANTIFKNR
jgi:hypothetical protein